MKESRTTPSLTLPGATDILDYTFDVAGSPTVDRRNAYYATRVPGASDNSDAGFKRGSVWIFGDQVYVCVNSDPSQAQWVSAAPSPVLSVNGQTGDVELTPEDVGAATAEQGALADTAIQPNTNASLGDLEVAGPISLLGPSTGAPPYGVLGVDYWGMGENVAYFCFPGPTTNGNIFVAENFTTISSNLLLVNQPGRQLTINGQPIGDAVFADSADFATAAQGDLADTAIQKNTSDATPVNAIRVMTQAEYDALGTYDPNTLYFIK